MWRNFLAATPLSGINRNFLGGHHVIISAGLR